MKTVLDIRDFRPEDEAICRDISVICLKQQVTLPDKAKQHVIEVYSEPGYWIRKSEEYPIYVAEKDKQIVATGAFGLDPKHPKMNCIKKLYVLPEFQRHGIGTRFLEFLEDIIRDLGINTDNEPVEVVHSSLYAFNNSIGFYRKNGYLEIGRYVFEGIVPTTEMRKPLE